MTDGGEQGTKCRGKEGLESNFGRGNKGRKMDKYGRGRVEDSQEPRMAASVQVGHMHQMMRDGLKHYKNGVQNPEPIT
jgi:hypothetical protein